MSESDSKPGTTGGIGRSSMAMAAGSLASRVLGIVRNAMMIAIIGAEGTASTAFNTANTLPNSIFALLQGGLLTTLFLPQLTKAMARPDGGRSTVNALLTWSFVIVGVVAALATAFAGPLMQVMQLSGPTLELGVAFAYICLPQIFFYGAYTIWSQLLYARDRFGITMWAPVFANVVQIAGMALFLSRFTRTTSAERWTPEMIALLGGTFTLGIAVQAFALLPALRGIGLSWRPELSLRGHGFRATARLASWTIAAVTLAQLGGLATTAAINAATNGHHDVPNITVYLQAFQMFFVPHGIVTISILTAIFPRLTRAAQSGDTEALRADVTQALRVPLVAMVPITVAAVVLSAPGMAVVSPRMTEREVNDTALVFSIMALGLVPYAISGLQQRYSMAREDGRTNWWFTVVVVGVQLAAAVAVLSLPAPVAVDTVAWGMTLGNAIAAIWFLTRTQRELGGLPLASLGGLTVKLLVASLPAGLVAWLIVEAIRMRMGFGWQAGLVELAAGGAAFGALFYGVALLLRIQDVSQLTSRLTSRFRR